MEALFDKGELKVERLPNGWNKLIAVNPKAKASSRRTTTRKPVARCGTKTRPSDCVPVRTPLVARGRSTRGRRVVI